jgi:cytochrome P450
MINLFQARAVPAPARVPHYGGDLYSDAGILEPYDHYQRLRELGPVVWLSKQKVYAVTTYAECKAVLLDDATYVSGSGVALNPLTNALSSGTTLNSDGDEHERRRKLVAHRLTPRALRGMRAVVEAQASDIVDKAVRKRHVDGVQDLALALPMAIVPDLVGWPSEGRDRLLEWGAATFDVLGPVNRRGVSQFVPTLKMLRYARRVISRRMILPGSMADDVVRAADDGELAISECPALMVDYLAPSLDTTLSAIASALHLFAQHPDQWRVLKARPELLPNAVNEVVRLESPLRAFSRKVALNTVLAGVDLPAGSRVLVLYASANRDEREWNNPNQFDVTRDANRQLGFGQGVHGCAGQGLARLETQAILAQLLHRVARIVPTGEPSWALNNIIHRLDRLPIELVAERSNA